MAPNVIILTSGLSGSSVLTGLIARAGYWTGESTHKKKDYDTYENRELIDLNLGLFKRAGYQGNYLKHFSSEAIRDIAQLHGVVDNAPYRAFVDKCNQHRPWIWKDPRLWLTIRFWSHLLDTECCRFLLLTRGYLQTWVSATSRRQIVSYKHCRNYEKSIRDSATSFLDEHKLPYLHVRYESLIVNPAQTLDRLNGHLSTQLTVHDLAAVYNKPLYKKPGSSAMDYARAVLIYLKNYSERADAAPERE